MERTVKYPIGEQSFESLRKEGCLYVDKTRFIAEMTRQGGKYYFLGRPRRFGKSLFLSTLKCFFEAKRELFKGLYIDSNPNDITFDDAYADICGITEKELHDNFKEGIGNLAEKYRKTYDEMCAMLQKNYDGYRFAEEGSDVYNPWSVLNAMSKINIEYYWNETGLPTLIVESLKKINVDLKVFLNSRCSRASLVGIDLRNPRPIALLYQTGYLTIKHFDPEMRIYTLGIPNEEVAEGLMQHLMPYYSSLDGEDSIFFIGMFAREMREGDVKGFMTRLQSFFAATPYDMNMDDERNFHNAVYVLLTLLGLRVDTEVRTSDGRIDLTVKTDKYIYIIELKYNGTASEALAQIEKNLYAAPYASDPRQKILIGVNFSSKTHGLDDWDAVRM